MLSIQGMGNANELRFTDDGERGLQGDQPQQLRAVVEEVVGAGAETGHV